MVVKCGTICGQRINVSAQMVLYRTDASGLVYELCFKHSERVLIAQNKHPFCSVQMKQEKMDFPFTIYGLRKKSGTAGVS